MNLYDKRINTIVTIENVVENKLRIEHKMLIAYSKNMQRLIKSSYFCFFSFGSFFVYSLLGFVRASMSHLGTDKLLYSLVTLQGQFMLFPSSSFRTVRILSYLDKPMKSKKSVFSKLLTS